MTALTFSTSRGRPLVVLMVSFCACLVALGLAGVTQEYAFDEPSTLKYALTVAGPLFLMLVITAERPLLLVAAAIAVASPFAGFQATMSSYDIPLLWPLLLVAAVAIIFEDETQGGRTAMTLPGLLAVPLLLVPIADGLDTDDFVRTLGTLLAVAWVTYRAASLRGGMTIMMGAVAMSALLQAVLALWEYKTGSRLHLYGGAGTAVFGGKYFYTFEDANRPVGSLYDPISLGNVLAISVPVLLVLALRARGAARLAVGGIGVLVALALAVSLSRMSWIGCFAGLVLAVALLPRSIRGQTMLVGALGTVLIVVLALGLGGSSLRNRFLTLQDPTAKQSATATGDNRRVAIWGAAIDVFQEHPVQGVGVGRLANEIQKRVANVGTYTHAHSVYFQLLAEAGILGLALLITFVIGVWTSVRQALRRDRVLGAGMAGAALALMICWTTDWVLVYANVAASVAVVLGLIAAAGRTAIRRPAA